MKRYIEKIDIESLGEVITEVRDGKPFTSKTDPIVACVHIAEKVNKIIDLLNNK